MHQGKLVSSQIMMHLPLTTFRRCVAAHRGDHKVKDFTCLDQFLAMAFAQLTYRESLRDIEVNLRAQAKRRYHMGASQVQHKVSAAILPTSRSCEHSNRLRSDRRAHCLLHRQRLSASDSSSCCQRREWQTLDLSDQQLCSQSRDDRSTLSATMAGRVVLQVDQAAPSDQDLSGHQRERSQDANLDRGLHVRADRYTQQTIETAQQSSRNSTNPEFDYV